MLDEDGVGTTAGLLDALEWVMDNRATYNIRVVNISLGAAAVDSYRYDPLCLAVRSLVDAGVVVVAAAGNEGKNANGDKVYGLIHSPGIEPSAITVGASNTFDTDARDDDGVTTYSSRGPTRSYWTDTSNVVHHDNLVKPDMVAPGNKLVSAESASNALVTAHPDLEAYTDGNASHAMMRLSGTSMATPLVAGTAALLLQANPSLTPNMVKTLLMYTAQPLDGFNMFEQGAGQLNVEGAVRVATNMRTDCSSGLSLGDSLLTGSTPTHSTTIASFQFPWAGGAVAGHTYVTGTGLITQYQQVYDLGMLLERRHTRIGRHTRQRRDDVHGRHTRLRFDLDERRHAARRRRLFPRHGDTRQRRHTRIGRHTRERRDTRVRRHTRVRRDDDDRHPRGRRLKSYSTPETLEGKAARGG